MDHQEASSQLVEFEAWARDKRDQVAHHWQIAKQAVWLTLLAGTFLVYYLTDIMVEAVHLSYASF
jgi:Ca2+/H+ antiporter